MTPCEGMSALSASQSVVRASSHLCCGRPPARLILHTLGISRRTTSNPTALARTSHRNVRITPVRAEASTQSAVAVKMSTGRYHKELESAIRAVRLASKLCQVF